MSTKTKLIISIILNVILIIVLGVILNDLKEVQEENIQLRKEQKDIALQVQEVSAVFADLVNKIENEYILVSK